MRHILMECLLARLMWSKLGSHCRSEDYNMTLEHWLLKKYQRGWGGGVSATNGLEFSRNHVLVVVEMAKRPKLQQVPKYPF